MSVSRTPPADVRRQLRSEIGFGCPLCGSPHLEYHHFDPPFSIEAHHRPEGMIALCATHHAQADAFTPDQVRRLKTKKRDEVTSDFKWRRRHTVFSCGGNYAYRCNSMLNVFGIDIVYFEPDDDGYDTLCLNIYDVCMNRIFAVRRNDWISRSYVDDINAPPKANWLRMHSKLRKIAIDIEFRDRQRLSKHDLQVCSKLCIPVDENVIFCHFNGEIAAPMPVSFKPDGVRFGGNIMTGSIMSNCGTGIFVG